MHSDGRISWQSSWLYMVLLYLLFAGVLGCDVADCHASQSTLIATAAAQLQRGLFRNIDFHALCSYVLNSRMPLEEKSFSDEEYFA